MLLQKPNPKTGFSANKPLKPSVNKKIKTKSTIKYSTSHQQLNKCQY